MTNGCLQIGCENCGAIFFDDAKTLLIHYDERHMKKCKREVTITKYRQYLCDVCGKSYTQSSHLWQHLRFHRGVISSIFANFYNLINQISLIITKKKNFYRC